ncbi:starvation-inducible outer membrane lipoprotein [Paenibacillus sp. RC254]
MKCKILLTFLVTSFMLVAIVTVPLQLQDKGSSYQPTYHGEM